eukprot:scaffold1314_cov393-Prasinococcus_capsulatus_cf.AAC.10
MPAGGVQGSPDNAAFIASIPNKAFYEHFSEGIAHGYHQVDGWGGAYDKREKEFMNQHVGLHRTTGMKHLILLRKLL